MSRDLDPASEVLGAARAVADELRRFDARARRAGQLPLGTAKELNDGQRELDQIADADARIEAHLAALAIAVERARQWKQERVIELAGTSLRVAERTALFEQLAGELAAVKQELDAGARPDGTLFARAHRVLTAAEAEGLSELAEVARAFIVRLQHSEQDAAQPF